MVILDTSKLKNGNESWPKSTILSTFCGHSNQTNEKGSKNPFTIAAYQTSQNMPIAPYFSNRINHTLLSGQVPPTITQ